MVYNEEEIQPGEDFKIIVSVTNEYRKTLENLHIIVGMPGIAEARTQKIEELDAQEKVSKVFEIRIPKNMKSGVEQLRISVSNDEYKRVIYRELLVE